MLYNVNLEKYLNSKEQYIFITFLCTTHIQIPMYSVNFISGGGKKNPDSLYFCNHHKFFGGGGEGGGKDPPKKANDKISSLLN